MQPVCSTIARMSNVCSPWGGQFSLPVALRYPVVTSTSFMPSGKMTARSPGQDGLSALKTEYPFRSKSAATISSWSAPVVADANAGAGLIAR
jgi:hypothetical protein